MRGSVVARAALALTSTCCLALACSGEAFRAADEPSCDADCAGQSMSETAGTSGTGGSDTAGSGGAGGTAGSDAGGKPAAGAAGLGIGGVVSVGGGGMAGAGGGAPGGFPVTGVLDNFDRPAGMLGEHWMAAADDYSIKDQQLWCELCDAALWNEPFGANQEVFATFGGFDPQAGEINLVLRAEESATCELIEVLYSPAALEARVAYCTDGTWTDLDAVDLLLEPGDEFGGRISEDGTLEIFAKGELVATLDASGFPRAFGRIGVNGESGSSGLFWDDFGGGDWK